MSVVIVTGSSNGIGRATALRFLQAGHEVVGIDIKSSTIDNPYYVHYVADVRNKEQLPAVTADILVNNAGTQDDEDAIDINLLGVINCTEIYAYRGMKAIVNVASVSAHNGAEFPRYTASKGGVVAYTRHIAKKFAPYGVLCNSLSFGGVITEPNAHILNSPDKWEQIMSMTPLKKWMTAGECAEWIYFVTCVNRSMTAQDVIIDNGEMFNHTFVW